MLPSVIGQGQVPFSTTDAILAFSLYLAGVPFFDDNKPCINIYDVNILQRLGFTGQGLPLEDAVRAAVKNKKKGHLEWAFKQVPELDRFLSAYRKQAKEVEAGEGKLYAHILEIATEVSDPNERVVRMACLILKMRVQFINLWQKQVPLIRVFNEGQSTKTDLGNGKFKVSSHGFKIVSLNAKQETKDRMGL